MSTLIVEHRPGWAAEFGALGAALRAALGATALRIDHIGSTAVPGLCAKDVIDIQLSVARLDDAPDAALPALGYELRPDTRRDHRPAGHPGPDEDWAKRYYRERPGLRRVHLHVREAGRANQRYALLVRDYLRQQPAAAAAYGELKRRLAAALREPRDYAELKDPAMDLIHQAAEAWAAQQGWQPGHSDA